MPPVYLAISTFGGQNHVSMDCGLGFIRHKIATDAVSNEGARVRGRSTRPTGRVGFGRLSDRSLIRHH
jgi:hypothetical protein